MTDSGHPSRHGYVLCIACNVWRRVGETSAAPFSSHRPDARMCEDIQWCSDQINGRERQPGTYARSHLDAPETGEVS